MTTAQKIDGKALAADVRARLAAATRALKERHNIVPRLAVLLVGEDSASAIYVQNKNKAAQSLGIDSKTYHLSATISEAEILEKLATLNQDPKTHGILVQFPVPPQLSQAAIITQIAPAKDVDGLHPLNSGRLAAGLDALAPCTPAGCVMLAKHALGSLEGVRAVILGRSNLVGKPLAQLLLREHATVTLAHSRTRELPALCQQAELLVAAIGRAEFVKGDWVKQGAVVIDVGINRVPVEAGEETNKSKIVGDVDFAEAAKRAAYITPVPGGVGPMTIACLMRNTLLAAATQNGLTKAGLDELGL